MIEKKKSPDPDPDAQETAEPPAECRRCGAGLDRAAAAGPRWAQVIDVDVIRMVTEHLLGPGVPVLRDGHVRGGAARRRRNGPRSWWACCWACPVSAGWVDKAAARVSAQLGKAGFDEAIWLSRHTSVLQEYDVGEQAAERALRVFQHEVQVQPAAADADHERLARERLAVLCAPGSAAGKRWWFFGLWVVGPLAR